MPWKDGFCMRGAKEIQEREFTKLYLGSYGIVYNYVRSRMGSDDAEDVVADAFMLAARSFGSFDPKRAKFSTWVIKIAMNCMASHYRKSHATVDLEEVPEGLFAEQGEEDTVDDRELAHQLLGLLDDEERELVLMKYRDGKRNIEIAQELGMNPSTVSTMLSRALAKMRDASVR